MKTVVTMPDNAVSKLHPELLEDRVEINIQRKHFTFVYKIAYLPDDTSILGSDPLLFSNNVRLPIQIGLQPDLFFICFSQVLVRRRDHQPDGIIRQYPQMRECIALAYYDSCIRVKCRFNFEKFFHRKTNSGLKPRPLGR